MDYPDWIVSPSSWGARINYDNWSNTYKPTEGIVLHHGGGSNYRAHLQPYSAAEEMKQLRSWEAFHIDGRGWRGIAYNWAVGQSGNAYRLRGWNRPGAHTGDIDEDGIPNNDELASILFIGSGSRVGLSVDAQGAVERLRQYINTIRNIDFMLFGHKEVTIGTACPGTYGMNYVRTHRFVKEVNMTPEQEAKLDQVLALIENIPHSVWTFLIKDAPTGDMLHTNTVLRATRNDAYSIEQIVTGLQSAALTPEQIQAIANAVTSQVLASINLKQV